MSINQLVKILHNCWIYFWRIHNHTNVCVIDRAKNTVGQWFWTKHSHRRDKWQWAAKKRKTESGNNKIDLTESHLIVFRSIPSTWLQKDWLSGHTRPLGAHSYNTTTREEKNTTSMIISIFVRTNIPFGKQREKQSRWDRWHKSSRWNEIQIEHYDLGF